MRVPIRPLYMMDAITRCRTMVSPSKILGPVAQFLGAGAAGLAGVVLLASELIDAPTRAMSFGAGFFVLAFALALRGLRETYPHPSIGSCNVVTTARLMLTSVLVAALSAGTSPDWGVFGVALVAFALDGADGWLARREGYVSAFGARFDVEVDSALALILALLAIQGGSVGIAVLVLGLPRYVFLGAQYIWPWLNGPLPERFSRKVVCVLQISVLLLVMAPIVSASVASVAVAIAALALLWSFWLDIRLLWRARP